MSTQQKTITTRSGLVVDVGPGADLSGLDLQHADFRNLDLRDTNFAGSILDYANLEAALMRRANFRGAKMRFANMRATILADADFRDADFRGADLRHAVMRKARMDNAVVDRADLRDATLPRGLLHASLGPWEVCVTPTHMTVGCERRTLEEWGEMSAADIRVLDLEAADWMDIYGCIVRAMIATVRGGNS